LAVAPGGRTIDFWDATKLRSPERVSLDAPAAVLRCHDNVNAFVFAPDGQRLATAEAGSARIYEVASKRLLTTIKPPGRGDVYGVAFAPDGKLVATLGRRNLELKNKGTPWRNSLPQDVRLWDSFTGEALPIGPDLEQSAHTVAFHPGGRTLAAVHVPEATTSGRANRVEDRIDTIRLWNLAAARETFRFEDPLLRKHAESANSMTIGRSSSEPVAFSRDGHVFAAPGAGGIVLFETASGKPRLRLQGHSADITGLALTPDSKTLVSASWDSTVMMWDLTGLRTSGKLEGSPADLWPCLADSSPELAGQAIWTMVARPVESVEVLRKHVKQVPASQDVRKLIANLDDPSFTVRDKATRQLAILGRAAEELLTNRLRAGPSLEMSRRIRKLLQGLHAAPPQEQLQQIRGVEVLERIGTPATLEVLRELSNGAEGAGVTSYAREALDRVNRR
jgi:hypothetical protein